MNAIKRQSVQKFSKESEIKKGRPKRILIRIVGAEKKTPNILKVSNNYSNGEIVAIEF